MVRKGVKIQASHPRLHLLNRVAEICTALRSPGMPPAWKCVGSAPLAQASNWRVAASGRHKVRVAITATSVGGPEGPSWRTCHCLGKGPAISCRVGWLTVHFPTVKAVGPCALRVGWHYLEERPKVVHHTRPHWKGVVQRPSCRLGVSVFAPKARHC